jgi:Fe-S oxidoreductase
MLTLPERIIFALLVLLSFYLAWRVTIRIVQTIARGRGKVDWNLAGKRFFAVAARVGSMQPTFKIRFWPSLFHAFVAWGFIYYLLINVGDVLRGYLKGFHLFGTGTFGSLFRLGGDILSVGVLFGMTALILRRFVFRSPSLSTRHDVLLQPAARSGIRRDSAIVAGFIMIHVGARFFGETFYVAVEGYDPWMPFASAVAAVWVGLPVTTLIIGQHIGFWLAIGTILAFMPYFLYSKHLHLFAAPMNFLLKPERRSMGELDKLDFDDETIEQFGVSKLEDLGWEQILDAYACIMCYRCQDVCPAYHTGKVLSPAAMEINKRFLLNQEGGRLAKGEASSQTLMEYAIPPEAIWACTACGACVDICPTNNEPMRDILQMRRSLVLMDNQFPEELQVAFRGMERTVNPWNVPPPERLKWAEGLNVPTIDENPEPEILWWVGCAPATDARAQKTAAAFTKILKAASVNFAVLGENEQCTGDSARRAGNEFLFNELASANVELLNEVAPPRIVTTCPHCLHTLKNEYPQFGGNYEVIHHTQLINELLANGKLNIDSNGRDKITFHDPCFLGRQNDIINEPRQVLQQSHGEYVELPRHGKGSFCCGAGGAQMWKEEEEGHERVSMNRVKEAIQLQAKTLAVGCPFCMIMLNDAVNDANTDMKLMDVAEIIAAYIDNPNIKADEQSEENGQQNPDA